MGRQTWMDWLFAAVVALERPRTRFASLTVLPSCECASRNSAPAFHSPGRICGNPSCWSLWLQEMASRLQRLKKILQNRKAALKAVSEISHV